MKLIDDWKQAWKKFSVWAFIVIGAMPDIYTAVQGLGWMEEGAVPPALVWAIRIGAGLGIALRLIKQQAKAQ